MADETQKSMDELLLEVASQPASGTVDGQSFSGQKISDLIALDRYMAEKKALSSGKRGFKVIKLSGGSTND